MLFSYWLDYSLSILFYTINGILHALCLVIAYDLSEYRRTAGVREKLFSLFYPTWPIVLNWFENVCKIIPDWASEGFENTLEGAVYNQEKEETETKSVPGNLKNT